MLQLYEAMSGQQVNLTKSSIFFSKSLTTASKEAISSSLGVQIGETCGKYLGLPFLVGRSKRGLFADIKDRIWKKLSGWKERLLSTAGKEILIKSVVQAIPTYTMQCFKLPKAVCDDILSMIRNFWWGQKRDERKICWLSWTDLCKPKSAGGMGFRHLPLFNQALLAKQGWRLITQPTSLVAQIMKAKYYPNGDFMSASVGNRPSFLWRSLLHGRDLLRTGVRWRIGDGSAIKLWDDPWITLAPSFRPSDCNRALLPQARVSDLLISNPFERAWNLPLLKQLLLPHDVDIALAIPLGHGAHTDQLIWHHTDRGTYTVKSGYTIACEQQSCAASSSNSSSSWVWNKLWNLDVPPRVKNFLWRAAKASLPVGTNLRIRNVSDGICRVCCRYVETDRHALFECEWAEQVWLNLPQGHLWLQYKASSLKDLFSELLSREVPSNVNLFAITLWMIWKTRNRATFERTPIFVSKVLQDSLTLHAECQTLNMPPTVSLRGTNPASLQPVLECSNYQVNVDAALKNLRSAAGVLIVDPACRIVQAANSPTRLSNSVEAAELKAILMGLKEARRLALDSIAIASDCLRAIQRINSTEIDLSSLGLLVQDICKLASSFGSCLFKHVKRELNTSTHLLSQLGLACSHYYSWGSMPPPSVFAAAPAAFSNE